MRYLEKAHGYGYNSCIQEAGIGLSGNLIKKNEEKIVMEKTMDKIIALAKARGFVYPGSEIYGGLANTWDYGNLGVE